MKKGFFDSLIGKRKKSLNFGKNFWSRFFLTSIFFGILFIGFQTSILGDAPPATHTVTFSSASETSLAQMADVYIYTESGGVGSATQLTGNYWGNFSKDVTEGSSLTFFIDVKDAYNQSTPTVSWTGNSSPVSSGTGIAPYAGKVLYTIGGTNGITGDVSVSVSGLTKNTYSITFESGDSDYTLPQRVELYEGNGTTLINDWSTITVEHGDDISFVLKPKTGYDLSSADIKLNGGNFTPYSQNQSQITLRLYNVAEGKAFTVTDVAYMKYNVYFKDENSTSVGTDRAEINNETAGIINRNNYQYQLTMGSSVAFSIDLQAKYDRSAITVKVNGVTLPTSVIEGITYYTFTMSSTAPQATTITISGITINRYSSDFSLTDATYNGQVKAFYNDYVYRTSDNKYYQTGPTTEFYPTTASVRQTTAIPHGNDFQLYLQVLNTTLYNFDYDGELNQDITYNSSTNNALDSIINAASVTGVGSIVYNVNSSKTQVSITFKTVTDDMNIQIKSLKKVSYTISFDMSFDVPADMKNHIKLYKGLMMNFYDTGYFIKGDQIYGPIDDAQSEDNFITSTVGSKADSFYFTVNLPDGVLAEDSGGVQCTITSGSGSGTCEVPGYTVYSPDDDNKFSVIRVFELKDVTAESVSIRISGLHFSKRNVTFDNIGEGGTPTATITNYANESLIADGDVIVVSYGDSLKFKIVANEGYYLDDITKQVTLSAGQFEYASYSDHTDITVTNIQEDLIVSINLDTEKIPITFNTIEGAQYYKASNESTIVDPITNISGIVTVSFNEDYYFAVKAETGYDISSAILKKNGSTMTSVGTVDGGYVIFKIPSVTANVKITGSISKAKHNVSFEPNAVISASGSSYGTTVTYLQDGAQIAVNVLSVQYGGSTYFQVELADECSQSDLKVYCSYTNDSNETVKRELSSVNGVYTVTDVTRDMKVNVEELTLNQYVINFTATNSAYYIKSDGTQITSGTQVADYNTDYSFGVEANPGYVIGSSMVVNCKTASGISRSLTADATTGKYTISNIKENCTISIENVDNIVYTITLKAIDGVTYYNDTGAVISGSLKIKYGQNFEFAVGVADAYDDSIAGMYIVVNDGTSSNVSAQKLSSGRYIIANVTQDITVKVGNITKNKYTVTLTKIEGIDYYGTSGKIITGDNEVEHKGSLIFRVYLYPAYSDSSITVMLGDNEMTSDSDGMYTISGIDENKTVTVLGVETTKEVEVINKINSLSTSVSSLSDVSSVIEVTRLYNNLSDEKKKKVTNITTLENLQEQVKSIHHISNGVTVDNLDWYIKLVANPIDATDDAYTRIYDKLSSEYILSLYDIYLWDTLNDKRYVLPEDQTVDITLPMPDMTYFENPTGIHESSSDGKLEYMTLTLKSTTTTFSTTSFSAMGIIANRSSTPGRSSLLDAVDANVEAIKEYALSTYNSGSSGSSSTGTTVTNTTGTTATTDDTTEEVTGNISDKFKSSSNNVTATGSALRLTLVLMILILLSVSIWIIVKNRKKINKKNGN